MAVDHHPPQAGQPDAGRGVALAIAGIMLVLNVFSDAHINLVASGGGLVAAVCAACYFMMSDQVSSDPPATRAA